MVMREREKPSAQVLGFFYLSIHQWMGNSDWLRMTNESIRNFVNPPKDR